MTKFGVHAFSEALRQEPLHAGIRVTTVAPGFVETELQSHNRNPHGPTGDCHVRASGSARCCQPERHRGRDRSRGDPAARHVCINEIVVRPTVAGPLSRQLARRPTHTAVRRRAPVAEAPHPPRES